MAGLSAAAELDVEALVGGIDNTKERQVKLSETAYEAVKEQYLRIEAAIQDPYLGSADNFKQPWLG